MRDRLAGRLMVGGFATASASLIPQAIAALRTQHPGLDVRLLEAPTPQLLRALARRRLEVAVVATGEGLPDYDLEEFTLHDLRLTRGMGIAVPEDHHLAQRDWVSPEELTDQPWVVGPQSAGPPEFGVLPGLEDPHVAFTVRDWPARLGLVRAGLGIALVPGMAADVVPRGVRWVPLRSDDSPLRRQVWAATMDVPSPAAAATVLALQQQASSMA